jgi:predicted nucleic-acid-binding protein
MSGLETDGIAGLPGRNDHTAQKALADCRSSNLDFADALIGRLGQQVGCEFTLTFDRKASKAARPRRGPIRPIACAGP